ncbi:hypothetical protein [Bradyrhizobium sp. 25ACV]
MRNAIMPLFCPMGQIDFEKIENPNPSKRSSTVHGVVFDIFVLPGPDQNANARDEPGHDGG